MKPQTGKPIRRPSLMKGLLSSFYASLFASQKQTPEEKEYHSWDAVRSFFARDPSNSHRSGLNKKQRIARKSRNNMQAASRRRNRP